MNLNSLTLGGKTYDSFPDTNARERLNDIEYQTVTTDSAQIHSNLPEGNKTVSISGDGTYGDTVYAVGSADLIPRKTFNRKFPVKGITIEKSGLTYHISGTATAADNIHFIEENGNANIAFPNAAGKSFKMLTFSDKVIGNVLSFFVNFWDSDGKVVQTINKWGNLANQVSSYIGKTALTTVEPFSIPEGANISYMKIRLDTVAGTTYGNDFQVYIVPDDETQTATLTNGIAEFSGITANDVMSIPYSSTVKIEALLKSYIDYQTANAKGDTATYLTPEAFGAIGDGYANDIEAITACLAKAAETKQTVLMAQKYLVSAPIDIKGDDFNIIINDIVYNGTDTAVKIQGQRNTVKIHSITSSGIGVKFIGDGTKYSEWTLYNDLEVNTITAASHGIIFESITVALYQNTVRFNLISAGGDGCYGIAYVFGENGTYITENNFYGGNIMNCDWAIYNAGGGSRYMNVQVEGNVKGGFYITSYCRIVNPRWAESNRDGEYPFLKFVGTQMGHITIDNNVPLPICEIDLSESDENDSKGRAKHEGHFAKLNFPIVSRRFGVGNDVNTGALLATQALVWGKYLILKPHMAYRKEVTTETLDTRLIGQETTETEIRALSQLPTKFVVNSTNTEIYLHESYCAFGFNEFEVEQANGFTCKIYDKLNNLIFDGTDKGDGLYRFNVYKEATYCATRGYGLLQVDFLGHHWSVTKQADATEIWAAIDEIGGGVNEIEAMIDESGVLDE